MSTNPVRLNDGLTIPQLGFGTFKMPEADTPAMVGAALEIGYRHIDTAAGYENEEGVGEAIAASGLARNDIYVTTKLRNGQHLDAPVALRESLDKLGLEYVDLYLIHWPLPAADNYVAAWQSLIRLQAQGLTRSIGVSNFTPAHLERLRTETGVLPAVNQVEVHPSFTNDRVVAANAALGIVTESWSPIGRGADLDDPTVAVIAERLEATPAQVILAWHLAKGYVVIPKTMSAGRARENFESLGVRLTADDVTTIDGLDAGNRLGPDPDNNG